MDQLNAFIPAGSIGFIIVGLNLQTSIGSVVGSDVCKVSVEISII